MIEHTGRHPWAAGWGSLLTGRASLVAQTVKNENLPAMQETQVCRRSPGEWNGNPLQDSCLENSRREEPGGLQSMGLQRVRHD